MAKTFARPQAVHEYVSGLKGCIVITDGSVGPVNGGPPLVRFLTRGDEVVRLTKMGKGREERIRVARGASWKDTARVRATLMVAMCTRLVVFFDKDSASSCLEFTREAERFDRPAEIRYADGRTVDPSGSKGNAVAITLGDVRFQSKKDAAAAVREILHNARLNAPLLARQELAVRDLLMLHEDAEEKIGCGIRHIEVRSVANSRGFFVVRVDGSETDFSYRKCLGNPSHRSNVRQAMRFEIRDQVGAFKLEGIRRGDCCAITGDPLNEGCHVDHVEPFETLVRAFLSERGLSVEDVAVIPTPNGIGDMLEDREIANAWQSYHRQRATLRLVTPHANLSLLRRTLKGVA